MKRTKPVDERKRSRLMARVRAAAATGIAELSRQHDAEIRREHEILRSLREHRIGSEGNPPLPARPGSK